MELGFDTSVQWTAKTLAIRLGVSTRTISRYIDSYLKKETKRDKKRQKRTKTDKNGQKETKSAIIIDLQTENIEVENHGVSSKNGQNQTKTDNSLLLNSNTSLNNINNIYSSNNTININNTVKQEKKLNFKEKSEKVEKQPVKSENTEHHAIIAVWYAHWKRVAGTDGAVKLSAKDISGVKSLFKAVKSFLSAQNTSNLTNIPIGGKPSIGGQIIPIFAKESGWVVQYGLDTALQNDICGFADFIEAVWRLNDKFYSTANSCILNSHFVTLLAKLQQSKNQINNTKNGQKGFDVEAAIARAMQ